MNVMHSSSLNNVAHLNEMRFKSRNRVDGHFFLFVQKHYNIITNVFRNTAVQGEKASVENVPMLCFTIWSLCWKNQLPRLIVGHGYNSMYKRANLSHLYVISVFREHVNRKTYYFFISHYNINFYLPMWTHGTDDDVEKVWLPDVNSKFTINRVALIFPSRKT